MAIATGEQALASDVLAAIATKCFHDLAGGQNHHAANNAAFGDWDVSAIVPAGSVAVLLGIGNIDSGGARLVGGRKNGSALARTFELIHLLVPEDVQVTVPTECDANRIIEIYAQLAADVHFNILGYWT